MGTHYILAATASELGNLHSATPLKLNLAAFGDGKPRSGDTLLLALERNGAYEAIEPVVFAVIGVSQKNVTLERQQGFLEPASFDRVRPLLKRGLVNGANTISPDEYQKIQALLGPPVISEMQMLAHIVDYISARGYYFDDETIANYHVCLKTRPFVILAGLSGTGKSKLSQLYAEAIGHTVKNERYRRVAVRPSWNDDRYLLGYLNPITGDYVSEPALDFIIAAEQDRENLYFFCLDEMNLAHVEYYFSQFLSALEEEDAADRRIPLYSQSMAESLATQGRSIAYEREVIIPPNLLFTGTINVDETTQPLSDKVIDRANTLEFFEVDLDKVPGRRPTPDPMTINAPMWTAYRATEPVTTHRQHVVNIGQILNKAGLGLGYRVLREIEIYLANSQGIMDEGTAFDLQVKQRILPRVRGTLTMRDTLRELRDYLDSIGSHRSVERLREMEARLIRDGYTSFWR